MNGGPANGVSNTADVGNPAVDGVDQIPIFPPELKVTFSRYYFLKTQLQNDTLEKKNLLHLCHETYFCKHTVCLNTN